MHGCAERGIPLPRVCRVHRKHRFLEARLRYFAGLLFWNIAIRIEVGEERLLR